MPAKTRRTASLIEWVDGDGKRYCSHCDDKSQLVHEVSVALFSHGGTFTFTTFGHLTCLARGIAGQGYEIVNLEAATWHSDTGTHTYETVETPA